MKHRHAWRRAAGLLGTVFGIATLVEGSRVLFGGAEARAAAGHVVPFVLAFTFGAGFVYVAAGLATLAGRSWASWLARALAIATSLVFVALGVHILRGHEFEARTVAAMTLRTVFWMVQAAALPRLLASPSPSRVEVER